MNTEEQRNESFCLAALGLYLVVYCVSVMLSAAHQPLWMDEILTVWAARLPTAGQVFAAIRQGSEFAPPTFALLIHALNRISGDNAWLRLPSLIATVCAGGCAFVIFRRYLGTFRAAFGLCIMLEVLRPWALQVRPYALETAFFAASLLCWDEWNRRPNHWCAAGIAISLTASCSLHFYAALFIACLAIMEVHFSMRIRKLRLPVWIALITAGASLLVWLPLMSAVSRFNAGDTSSPAYYAKPELLRLMHSYTELFPTDSTIIVLLLAGLAAVAADRKTHREERADSERVADLRSFWPIISSLVIFPVLVFLVAKVFTGTYNTRYAICGAMGLSGLIAVNLTATFTFRRTIPWILIAASVLTMIKAPMANPQASVAAFAGIAEKLPGNQPIVVADGQQFFPLMESAPPDLRARIRYVTMPVDVPVGDPTNEHQIERWKTIDPALPVERFDDFLRKNPEYFVVSFHTSDDTPARYLLLRNRIDLVGEKDGAMIYRSRLSGWPE